MLIWWVLTLQLGCTCPQHQGKGRLGTESIGLCQLFPVPPTCPPQPGTLCLHPNDSRARGRGFCMSQAMGSGGCDRLLAPPLGPDILQGDFLWPLDTKVEECPSWGRGEKSLPAWLTVMERLIYNLNSAVRKYKTKPGDLLLYASPRLSSPGAANVCQTPGHLPGNFPCACPWSFTFFTQRVSILTPHCESLFKITMHV